MHDLLAIETDAAIAAVEWVNYIDEQWEKDRSRDGEFKQFSNALHGQGRIRRIA